MILGIGFLLMVSLAFSAGVAALSKWWDALFQGWSTVAFIINLAASLILSTAVFAMIYKLMPRVQIDWRDVWIGAVVTALLFITGKFLIGLYLGRSGISARFGSAGSLVVVLLWVYYSAQVFLFGAEFTWAYSHKFGSRKGQRQIEAFWNSAACLNSSSQPDNHRWDAATEKISQTGKKSHLPGLGEPLIHLRYLR
jgi:membrane protein